MRRMFALAMILSLVTVAAVEAQISECQDVFSVYFDTGATQFNVTYPGGFAPLNVYLMITRPSGDYIRAWECTIVETNNFTVQGTWTLNGGLDVDGDAMDFVVGMGTTPHPAAPAVILASKTMYGAAPGAGSAATFTVKGVAGSVSFPGGQPGYVHTLGINTPCSWITGMNTGPHACVNAGCTIQVNDCGVVEDFAVEINAAVGGYLDQNNVAGASLSATDGYDPARDIPEPPLPPSGYVQLAFPHPEWMSPFGDAFRTDIRSHFDPDDEAKMWPFEFMTDQTGTATLAFLPDFDQTQYWDLSLIDVDRAEIIDLWASGLSFSFTAIPGQIRHFRLVVGPNPVPPLTPSSRTLQTGWSMVGAPLSPDAPGTFDSVLNDDSPQPTFIYSYLGGGGYQYRSSGEVMSQGTGFWVGATTPFTWTMEGQFDLDGVLVPMANGWNMLGAPLWSPMDLTDAMVDYQGSRYDYATAIQMGLVGNGVHSYNPTTGSYDFRTTIDPWYGYWLAAYRSDVALWFHYINIGADKSPTPDFIADDVNWRLSLGLDGVSESVTVGRLEKAAAGFDPTWDQPRPPRAPVAASRPELWLDGAALDLSTGDQLTADYRAADGSDVAWDLVVTAPAPGPVTLRWDAAEWGGREDLQVYLPHQNRVAVMSMRAQSSLTLDVGAAPVIVRLRTPDLSTGAPEVAAASCQLRAVPNPFNPRTEIVLTLPRAGRAEVRIHDVLGRTVKRFAVGEVTAGEHRLAWLGTDDRGRDVASGAYFASLHVDGIATGAVVRLSLVR